MNEEFSLTNLFGEEVTIIPETEEVDMVGPKGRPDFNIWSFTDAVGARRKKEAWVLYQKALAAGLAPEEIFYKLVWQVKTLLLAQKTKTAEEAGMKEYPYSKAKVSLKNFTTSELQNLSTDLVLGYHGARRGEGEMETMLEKIILSL
jgi:DNA polymerase III delta subunit